ncbi:hypothetical protein PoB_004708900 [Plakobranchus ocellatus]|uniref:Uncharacterized protein n=1 Tax=Plakobranchus ocellatus TaxID=259542 RepID=A0AAV4BKA6_9GAST|nr:hypothetical protein PoB_004708900 [Plakobranchus ocellatus]
MRRLREALGCRPITSNSTFKFKFTEIELDTAVRKGKTDKAPGLDDINQEILEQLPRQSMQLHSFPALHENRQHSPKTDEAFVYQMGTSIDEATKIINGDHSRFAQVGLHDVV